MRGGAGSTKKRERHQTKVGDCNKHQAIFLYPFFVCSIHIMQKKARKLDKILAAPVYLIYTARKRCVFCEISQYKPANQAESAPRVRPYT